MFSFFRVLKQNSAQTVCKYPLASALAKRLALLAASLTLASPLSHSQDLVEPEMVLESPQRFWAKSFFFRDTLTAHPSGETLSIGDRSYVRIGTGKTGRNSYADSKLAQKLASLPLGQDYLFDATVLNRRTTYYLVITEVTDPTIATAPITSEFVKLIGAQEAILEHQAQAVMRDVLYQTQISLYVHAKRNGLRFEDFFREESLQSDETIEIIRQTVRMMERQTTVTPSEALSQFMKKALNDYYGGDAGGFKELAISPEEKQRIDAELAKEFAALGREMPEPPPAPQPLPPPETAPPKTEQTVPTPLTTDLQPQEPVVINDDALRTTNPEVVPAPGVSDGDEALWRNIRDLSRPIPSPETTLPAITIEPPPIVLEPAPVVNPVPEIPAPAPEPEPIQPPPAPEPEPIQPPPAPEPLPEPVAPEIIPEIIPTPMPPEPVAPMPEPVPTPVEPTKPATLLPDLFDNKDPLAPVIPSPPIETTPVEPPPIILDIPDAIPQQPSPVSPEPAVQPMPTPDIAPAIPITIPETLPEVTPDVLDTLIRDLSNEPVQPGLTPEPMPELPPTIPEPTPGIALEPAPTMPKEEKQNLPAESGQWPPAPEQDPALTSPQEKIPAPEPKKGFFGRLFGSSSKETKVKVPPSEPVQPAEPPPAPEPAKQTPLPMPSGAQEQPPPAPPQPENPPAEEPGGVYDPDVQFEFKFRKK